MAGHQSKAGYRFGLTFKNTAIERFDLLKERLRAPDLC